MLYFNNVVVLGTLIDAFVERYHFNTHDSGFFGTLNVIGGIFGSFIYGYFLNKTERYKTANVSIGIF